MNEQIKEQSFGDELAYFQRRDNRRKIRTSERKANDIGFRKRRSSEEQEEVFSTDAELSTAAIADTLAGNTEGTGATISTRE